MTNEETFTILDEFGNQKEAQILNVLEIDSQDYLIYAVIENDEEEGIYASKIIRTKEGTEDIVPITDKEEQEKVTQVVKEYMEHID